MHRLAAFGAVVLAAALFAAPARADAPTILVDGAIARTDVPPIVVDGHVLVPLRGVFERFGADVTYDSAKNIAVAQRNGVVVKIDVGTSDAWIDGKHVTLETPAREFAGRVEVPLRFVADALGVSVDYDADSNTVVVVSGGRPGNFVTAGPGTPSIASSSYVSEGQRSVAPSVSEERPAPNSLVGAQYPQIYARLGGGSSPVDPATVRVLVDGADVTDAATVSSAYVAYTPASALSGGSHAVEISGQSDDGTPFDESWSFRIESDMSSSYVSSVVGYAPAPFGYPRFGFFPPGFSVFAPGPQFFFEDEPIIIVFFSPFFNGNGFFTLSGFPGQFPMTPWLGCPGFFWSSFSVPAGLVDPDAVIGAHFTTIDGRRVIAHATAPLHIDGTRKAPPSSMRFAVRARLIDKPLTPRVMVAYRRIQPAARIAPIARRVVPVTPHVPGKVSVPVRISPIGRHPLPVPRRPQPVIIPRMPVVTMPRVTAPAPVQIPMRPPPAPVVIPPVHIAPLPQAPPPVIIPKKPPA